MRARRSLILLLVLAGMLAALSSILGNLSTDLLPPGVRNHALLIFGGATASEFFASILLDLLSKAQPSPLRRMLAYGLISLGGISATLGGIVSSFAASDLPESIQPYVVHNLISLLVAVTLLTIVIAIAIHRLPGALRLTLDDRSAFLVKVHERYNNRLRDSLGDAAHIILQLREEARVVARPALARRGLVERQEQAQPQPPPVDVSIERVYDEARGELVILGEPGAGKTTLLVELALQLVSRANRDKQLRMPVIFSLASWAVRRRPLEEWMVVELLEAYDTPREVAAAWVEADEILPLLDGLDEIASDDVRDACAKAIQDYHQAHERVPLVVCCRSEQYAALPPTRLQLDLVMVEPLTAEQVDEYLAQGEGLDDLRSAIASDKDLRSAVTTPLILRVMALAYQGMDRELIPRPGDTAEWRKRLFDDYVSRMLRRSRGAIELGMPQNPDIRDQPEDRARHRRSTSAGLANYSEARTRVYLGWLAAQMTRAGRNSAEFYLDQMQWDWVPDNREHTRPPIEPTKDLHLSWRGVVGWLTVALIAGLVCGLVVGIDAGRNGGAFIGLLYGAAFGLGSALIIGLPALAFGRLGGSASGLLAQKVKPSDLRRPGEGVRRSLRNGVVGGVLVGVVYVLGVGLAYGLGVVLVGGLAPLIFGGIVVGVLVPGLVVGLIVGLLLGVPAGFLEWYRLGGGAYVQHRELLRELERQGLVPHNYAAFLDFAATHILLQRIGGSYRFIHPLLRDYFAEQWNESRGEPAGHPDTAPLHVAR